MSGNKEFVLMGYSGHGYVVTEAAMDAGMYVRYYCDRYVALVNPFQLSFIGNEKEENFQGWGKDYHFILGIGDNAARQRIASIIIQKGESLASVIHPSAGISSTAKIGAGFFGSRNISVNALSVIGNYAILNTGCIVEHGCILGEAVHIAPGAVLAGDVRIGDRSFIGANAVVKQGITIGKDVVIGAGTVVITDIPDDTRYVGNPARQIHGNK